MNFGDNKVTELYHLLVIIRLKFEIARFEVDCILRNNGRYLCKNFLSIGGFGLR